MFVYTVYHKIMEMRKGLIIEPIGLNGDRIFKKEGYISEQKAVEAMRDKCKKPRPNYIIVKGANY